MHTLLNKQFVCGNPGWFWRISKWRDTRRTQNQGRTHLTLFLKWHISSKIAHTLFTGDRQFVPSNPGWLWRVSSRGTQEGTQEGHKPRGGTHLHVFYTKTRPMAGMASLHPAEHPRVLFSAFRAFFSGTKVCPPGTHGGTQFWAGGTLEDTKNDVTESTGTHRTWKGHKKAQNGTQRDTKTGKRTHSPWTGKWQEWPLCVLQSITGCFFLHFKYFFSRGHT